jgi:hypothetical protein
MSNEDYLCNIFVGRFWKSVEHEVEELPIVLVFLNSLENLFCVPDFFLENFRYFSNFASCPGFLRIFFGIVLDFQQKKFGPAYILLIMAVTRGS